MLPKFLKAIIIFIFVFLTIPHKVNAANNFTTSYHVTYNVKENGLTHANLNIGLTNTTPEYYASSYKIQVGFEKIENIRASDPDGPINPVVEKNEDGYVLNLNFNKKTPGLGRRLDFSLSFDTPDVAKKHGKIWEINIPGIANPEEFDTFIVEIKVPTSFGKPAFTKPYQPVERLVFDKNQLGKSGISLSFGDRQFYSFHLLYHLKNENLYPGQTHIALPPKTNYQDIFIQAINPRPENVTLDKDGNWLATFNLGPSQKLDVTVDGKAEIFLNPRQDVLTPQDMQKYLEPKQYWPSDSSSIKKIADELKTPENIYKFVVKALKYDFSRVTDNKPRLGAINALKNPDSAVCLEYTDLFITLARAAGIPAREVNGFAYTQNPKQRPLSLVKDILHAWPEYYDEQKKTWIMIDPTWGSTTGGVDYFTDLDYDHFAFVVKGLSSTSPIPAGGYKLLSDKYTKDISVDFAQSVPQNEQNFEIVSLMPKITMGGVPIKGKIIIRNIGQSMTDTQVLDVSSSTLTPKDQAIQIPQIPPFGQAELDIVFDSHPLLTTNAQNFTASINGKQQVITINFSPFLIQAWWIYAVSGLFGILLVGAIIYILRKIIFKK